MHSSDITFSAGTAPLSGTFTRPDLDGPVPAVLLITGSGPLDRDANWKRMRFDTSRQLAVALAQAGVASLRYDKRGVGASPGDWRAVGLHDNIDDAIAALDALAAQDGIDPARLFVIGHSEGAVIAGAVAAARPSLAGVGLISAAARCGEEVLVWQAERIQEGLPLPVRAILRVLRTDFVAKVRANHAKLKATTTDVARVGGAKINARWFREFIAYDPTRDLEQLTMPVLAVTGSKDLQVDPADLEVIRTTVHGPVTVHRLEDLTHTLRRQASAPSLKLYKRELQHPVDAQLLDIVTDWVLEYADRPTSPSPQEAASDAAPGGAGERAHLPQQPATT